MAMHIHRIYVPNPCSESMHKTTETSNANIRYPKSLNPRPTVANNADVLIVELVGLRSRTVVYVLVMMKRVGLRN